MLDVISLYTNVPHEERLDTCKETLNKWEVLDPLTEEIVHLTSIVLKRNNFSLDYLHFLQKQGTVMGTRMAPLYENNFTGKFEYDLL